MKRVLVVWLTLTAICEAVVFSVMAIAAVVMGPIGARTLIGMGMLGLLVSTFATTLAEFTGGSE